MATVSETVYPRNGSIKEKNPQTVEHAATDSADDLLETLGFQPELTRNRSTWQVAFMSFVLASIPYGLATTLYYPIIGGGPVTIIWGWLAVSLIILCVAISLGEITSVYPTAGGVYYQTFMLSPPSYRRVAAWICGWAYVAGNITITLAVNFGTTLFFIACINVFESEPGVGVFEAERYQGFLIFLAITLLTNAISSLGNRWLPILDTFAIFWTFAGVISLVTCVLAIAKNGRRDAEFVFTNFTPQSGWVPGWSFMIGLLHAGYATSSTGMIISMCEEVRHPSTQVPKAMVGTILLNTICGLIFLIPLVFVIPDLAELAALASGQPLPTIIKSAVGSAGGAFGLLIPLMVLAIMCGVGCTTASSRATWAFARDGAIPGSRWWKQINHKLDDVPLNAMMLCMVIEIVLGLIYFGSTAAFNAFSGAGVIFLTVSYAVPIAVSLIGGRKHLKAGVYDFGVFGVVCNVISIAWSLLILPLFCMPSYIPTTLTLMNYASVVFFGFTVISAAWYIIWGRRNYQGPPTHEDTALEDRRASIAASYKHH
ncbi:hypothetical protein Dda_4016 [Drechslerella dactyloides]|uniref:Amino acid permease n=1 Tax=Drechslerella dactyloides TaxID=74499 RepID=A0AAD6J3B4_DREDA|nr:hypothetical protein Dda_4016 [Drechslerella dactyloides]